MKFYTVFIPADQKASACAELGGLSLFRRETSLTGESPAQYCITSGQWIDEQAAVLENPQTFTPTLYGEEYTWQDAIAEMGQVLIPVEE